MLHIVLLHAVAGDRDKHIAHNQAPKIITFGTLNLKGLNAFNTSGNLVDSNELILCLRSQTDEIFQKPNSDSVYFNCEN